MRNSSCIEIPFRNAFPGPAFPRLVAFMVEPFQGLPNSNPRRTRGVSGERVLTYGEEIRTIAGKNIIITATLFGGVAEWLKAAILRTVSRAPRPSWVRISPPPPLDLN